jgi:hypothetical protein
MFGTHTFTKIKRCHEVCSRKLILAHYQKHAPRPGRMNPQELAALPSHLPAELDPDLFANEHDPEFDFACADDESIKWQNTLWDGRDVQFSVPVPWPPGMAAPARAPERTRTPEQGPAPAIHPAARPATAATGPEPAPAVNPAAARPAAAGTGPEPAPESGPEPAAPKPDVEELDAAEVARIKELSRGYAIQEEAARAKARKREQARELAASRARKRKDRATEAQLQKAAGRRSLLMTLLSSSSSSDDDTDDDDADDDAGPKPAPA